MIQKKIYEILVCTLCKGKLEVINKENSTFLNCCSCKLRFAVERGIPVMLKDSATIINIEDDIAR